MNELIIPTAEDSKRDDIEHPQSFSTLTWQTIGYSLGKLLDLQKHEYIQGFKADERKLIVVIGKRKI